MHTHTVRLARAVATAAVAALTLAPAAYAGARADEADLSVTLTAPDRLRPSGLGSWTVSVRNAGPASSGGTLTLDLPDGIVLETGPATICELGGARATCAVSALAPDATRDYAFTARPEDYAEGAYRVTATIAAEVCDPAPANDTAARTTVVDTPSHLSALSVRAPLPGPSVARLAATGAESHVAQLSTVAGLLLAAGTALMLLARRIGHGRTR
ncbi:hypothetical protein GTY65_06510 [Streptomyces sp. SID8379]|uniref:DUF11 domain-containing protein n=1 Tax=unclassified Streptomyces TaxID=2593676 RepID=UPI00037C45ED|nr:DUF11 domain-containing protein [Streptomyces sp. HmicA12]MYW63732.1 hypothetical protein [Streptomyces sp. SID8379]